MQRVVEYTVVDATTLKSLQKYVLQHIEAGWQPLGGVATPSQGYFVQALVMYER